ncbi:MAG: sigma-54-dependent transcriptional regulator [Planctomycetota bacterium]
MAGKVARVLIVDDEPHMVDILSLVLKDRYLLSTAADGETAIAVAAENPPHVVLLDIMLPGMSGMEVLKRIKESHAHTEVIMVTALDDVRKAVEAMKAGALDYIAKPFEEDDLLVALKKAVEKSMLNREVFALREEVSGVFSLDGMVGASNVMQDLFKQIAKVAARDVHVLITGESGTGKELIARAIHYKGARRRGPFVAVNCAQFGSDITDSELFGHVRGAFTGASALHKGKFEQADGGTLFLDEIGAMPLPAQAKLLRILEEKKVVRVGGEKNIHVDVRVIAATNVDLQKEVEAGSFREDLYFRLKVIHLMAPSLRVRPDDIPSLVDHFLAKHRAKISSPVHSFSPETLEVLKNHAWKGNVRELENVVLTLICLSEEEVIHPEDLEMPILGFSPDSDELACQRYAPISREELLAALERVNWNISAAARELGVHRNTVHNQMERLNIQRRKTED